jgi:hypothetical protein
LQDKDQFGGQFQFMFVAVKSQYVIAAVALNAVSFVLWDYLPDALKGVLAAVAIISSFAVVIGGFASFFRKPPR